MKKQILYSLLFLFMTINAFGWGGKTHKKITEYSWRNSGKLGNGAFLLRLNLDRGMLYERLSDGNEEKTLDEWLQYGAEHEDDTDDPSDLIPDRSNYHFHNSLKFWWEAGLSDMASGVSAIYWAQAGVLQDEISNEQGDRSWQKAREYYYKALTETQYPTWRKNFYAEMFKILGHQAHLLQDMAVPDHVRNDAHVLNNFKYLKMKNNSFRCIEGWADYNIGKVETIAASTPLKPSIDFSLLIDPQSPVPIAFLSDTRQYKTSQTPSAGLDQGLAEYTNANFFSEDTIFTEDYQNDDKHWFPHPAKSETNVMSLGMPREVTAQDSRKDWIKPVIKNGGENLNNLVFAGYFDNFIDKAVPLYKFSFFLSDVCHEEYASKLVPRAVGYSAALINYFFRGEIEITLPVSAPESTAPQLDGIYSFCFVPEEGFKKISVMAKNITPDNEEMTNGHISLVVSYRLGSGTPFVPNPPVPGAEKIYKVYPYINPSEPNNPNKPLGIPRDTPIRLDFDLTSSPLPTDAVDVTLAVVFKGDLGAEKKGDLETDKTYAVAIGFKDISEPTPVDLFNNTDLVCFNGNYVNYADPALIQQVDTNHNGVIDCGLNEISIIAGKIKPIYLSFNSKVAKEDNYYYKFPETNPLEIMPGKSHRFFVLTDDYPAITKMSVLVHIKNVDLENSLVPYSGVCPSAFSNNKIDDIKPYFNKLEWNVNEKKYKHSYAPIRSIRGLFVYIFKYFDNVHIPDNTSCSINASSTAPNNSGSAENNGTNKIEGGAIIQVVKENK